MQSVHISATITELFFAVVLTATVAVAQESKRERWLRCEPHIIIAFSAV